MQFFTELITLLVISTLSSYIIMRFGLFVLRKIRILDHPERYPSEWNRAPAPYGIGVLVFINFALISLIALPYFNMYEIWERKYWIILILASFIALVSFIDDLDTIDKSYFSLHPMIRLFFQIGIGAIIGITSIKISYISNLLGPLMPGVEIWELSQWMTVINENITIYWIPLIFTIIWYVLVFNSLNWSDGVSWLTGWLSVITFIVIAILSVKLYLTDTTLASQENSKFVLRILMILIPSVILLTYYDITRKWIMGDSWTMFLGFIIATLSIIAGGKIATASSVLWIYLIDAIYVIAMRIFKKQNPLKWDKTYHLHYRLLKFGLSKTAIRTFIYTLAFFFWFAAIFLDRTGKIILFAFIAVIVVFITKILSIKR